MSSTLFRTKKVEQSILDTEEPEHALKKSLSALDLTVFGVGVIIGTGIFVLTGTVAKNNAGPAVALAFVVAGVVCALAALCYAEFASTVPVAGSAYTFSYASLGELPAWIIGWDLVLEFALGTAVVAVGWSGYIASLLDNAGIHLPEALSGRDGADGFGFDILAALLVLVLTGILVLGTKLSARVTSLVVAIKVTVVLTVIVAGAFFIKGDNYDPFIPKAQEVPAGDSLQSPLIQLMFGWAPSNFGVMGGSLLICTTLYVAVSIVVTGMQKYTDLSVTAPLADAFKATGHPWFAGFISFGAAVGLTTVCMILLLGQTRVFFAMSRDGLLPTFFSHVHPKFRTPHRPTILLGVVIAIVAGFTPLSELAELVNIGTLFAFVVVAIGVIILRKSRPDLPRAFRTPWVPVIPILSVLASLWLMLNLPAETWLRFAIWMVLGFAVYFLYGRTHSRLNQRAETEEAA